MMHCFFCSADAHWDTVGPAIESKAQRRKAGKVARRAEAKVAEGEYQARLAALRAEMESSAASGDPLT